MSSCAACGAGKGCSSSCLLVVLAYNITRVPNFLTVTNQINLFQLGIEKAIVVLVMTFVIISGEIDLSVASMMGLSAAIVAALFERGCRCRWRSWWRSASARCSG